MRTVASNIFDMGLTAGDEVTLQLVDSVGNVCTPPVGGKLDETIVIADDVLTLTLMENELIPMQTSYKITLPDGRAFWFRVPKAPDNEETVHDLEALMRIGCVSGAVDVETGVISESFLARLNDYLLGKQADFSAVEMDVVGLYVYYADIVEPSGRTVDAMRKLDAYLATIEE